MDIINKLKKRLSDELNNVQRGVGAFGDSIQQPFRDRYVPIKSPIGPTRQVWQPSIQTQAYKVLEPFQKGVESFAGNPRTGAKGNIFQGPLAPFQNVENAQKVLFRRSGQALSNIPQLKPVFNNPNVQRASNNVLGPQQSPLQDIGSLWSGAATIAGAYNPAGVIGMTALGTGIRSASDKLQGKKVDFLKNLQQSYNEGVPMAGTNKLIPIEKLKGVGKLNAVKRIPIKSALNVGQGLVMDKAAGLQTTPESVATDALMPIFGEVFGKTLGKSIKEGRIKVEWGKDGGVRYRKATGEFMSLPRAVEQNILAKGGRTIKDKTGKLIEIRFPKDLFNQKGFINVGEGIDAINKKVPQKGKGKIGPLKISLKDNSASLNRGTVQLDNLQSDYSKQGVPLKGESSKLPLVNQPYGNDIPPITELKEMQLPSKIRKFAKTVIDSNETPKPVKEEIAGRFSSYYDPTTNKETVDFVTKNILSKGEDYSLNIARNGNDTNANATAMLLIKKYLKNNEFEKANDLISQVTPRFTKQGQAIQILSLYNRLTPEGALRYAQNVVDKANAGKTGRELIKIDTKQAQNIKNLANDIKGKTGREKDIATAKLVQEIQNVVPASIGQKISTIQAMAQLLNPKTAIRNVFGNLAFQAGENVSRVVGTPIDMATSLVTGKRTRTFPSVIAQGKGFVTGLKEGTEEALKGVNTQPDIKSQFDLPRQNVFKNPVGRAFEKLMNLELRATDRAFYKSAYEDSLNQQLRLAKTKVPTKEMIEQAHYDGLYRTFQDDNVVSTTFSKLKKALNVGKDFGIGDLVLKYPKTPGSLLMRGIEYSPAGFGKTVLEMGKPLFGKNFNQREFVDSFARAIVGTGGLLTTGLILNKLGIVTGKREKDKDINAVQNLSGLGQYKINTDALKRFIMSGFDAEQAKLQENDRLVSYDWVQPFAIGISMGANINQNGGKATDSVATILNSLQGGAETLAEQPLISGLQRAFGGYGASGLVDALVETVKGIPSSFVPTALSQVNQLMDNTKREYKDPNPITESMNLAKNKIPGLAQTLPVQYDPYGEPSKRYQADNNNAFNVFLNPAFVSRYKSEPVNNEVLRLYNLLGEKAQAPRIVDRKITINGENRELNGEQVSKYQQYVGVLTKGVFNDLVENPQFKTLPDTEKVKRMQNLLTDINSVAKIQLFGQVPAKNLSKNAKILLAGRPDLMAPYEISKAIDSLLEEAGYKKGKKPKKIKIPAPKIGKVRFKMPKTSTRNLKVNLGSMKPTQKVKVKKANVDNAVLRLRKLTS